jgi:hypothetical protein
LTEFGIPVDALSGFFAEQMAAHAQAANSPAGRWLQQNEVGLRGYLEAHPDVAASVGRMAPADGLAAVEYLALRYQRDGGAPAAQGGAPPVRTNGPDPFAADAFTGVGQIGIHSADPERAARQNFIKRRLRESIVLPD